jgi:hypothetical protein
VSSCPVSVLKRHAAGAERGKGYQPMTDEEALEAALTEAIEREYAARIAGLAELQAIHMDEIRAMRLMLENSRGGT